MIHNVDLHKTKNVPLVVNNFLTDNIYLSKGEIMGFMQGQSLDISEIVTETSTEPSPISLEEDDDTEGSKEQTKETSFKYNEKSCPVLSLFLLKNCSKRKLNLFDNEKKFITSPADIDIHRKVNLQDAEVTKEQQEAFEELCNEYKDIFSIDSSNIGETPLIEMEIDTSDSPPVTQRPYTLPSKHATWVQKELEILEKAGVIIKSDSPGLVP